MIEKNKFFAIFAAALMFAMAGAAIVSSTENSNAALAMAADTYYFGEAYGFESENGSADPAEGVFDVVEAADTPFGGSGAGEVIAADPASNEYSDGVFKYTLDENGNATLVDIEGAYFAEAMKFGVFSLTIPSTIEIDGMEYPVKVIDTVFANHFEKLRQAVGINVYCLTDIVLGENIETICDGAFVNLPVEKSITLVIPANVKTLGKDAFSNIHLGQITLTPGIDKIVFEATEINTGEFDSTPFMVFGMDFKDADGTDLSFADIGGKTVEYNGESMVIEKTAKQSSGINAGVIFAIVGGVTALFVAATTIILVSGRR